MESYLSDFFTGMVKFMHELDAPKDKGSLHKFYTRFTTGKLNVGKVMLRLMEKTKPNWERILKKDKSLFDTKFTIVPGVDLNKLWPKLSNNSREQVWKYMEFLHLLADCYVQLTTTGKVDTDKMTKEVNQVKKANKTEKEVVKDTEPESKALEKKKPLEFNPYEGVGGDTTFGVDDLLSGDLPPEENAAGSGGMFNPSMLASAAGLGNIFDGEKLKEQLGSLTPEEIEKAKSSIKKALAGKNDKVANVLSGMLDDVTDQLSKEDLSKGNPLQNIMKVAETIAGKLKPKMEKNGVTAGELFMSAKSLASASTGAEGPSMMESIDPKQLEENMKRMQAGMQNGQPPNMMKMMEMMQNMMGK